jgi:hypothetical protein
LEVEAGTFDLTAEANLAEEGLHLGPMF